ncbi:MAG: 5'/3'-nucleotidase SurE [Succinivibrionaceae bacterium]
MKKDTKILISNDDGVYAEGINTLFDSLNKIYSDVYVVAPDRNQSAASHSLTIEYPLRIQYINKKNFIAVKGTPTDSVYLAINKLLETKPNIVISGINEGANLGDDVIYSGTVAAAMEGRNLGFPAIAISLVGSTHYETAAYFLLKILEKVEFCPIPNNQILNVNVPDLPINEIKGLKITRLGSRFAPNIVVTQKDLRGKNIYWVGPQGEVMDRDQDTDFWAIEHNYVSVTPLHIDLTSYAVIDDLRNWCNNIK